MKSYHLRIVGRKLFTQKSTAHVIIFCGRVIQQLIIIKIILVSVEWGKMKQNQIITDLCLRDDTFVLLSVNR